MTRDERRMIDEAIAQGRVRRIPQGLTTCQHVHSWRSRAGRRPHRRAIGKIRALAAKGWTDAQIGRAIGRTRKAVSNLRYRHGIPAGQPKKRYNSGDTPHRTVETWPRENSFSTPTK